MSARIAFFLGGAAKQIRGGYKVLFIYANILAEQGFAVSIIFPASNHNNRGTARTARALRYLAGKVHGGVYRPDTWFDLYPAIETRWVWRSLGKMTQAFDLSIIADHAAGTDLLDVGATSRGKLVYLFQEYEYYMTGSETIRRQIETVMRGSDAVIAISPAARDVATQVRGSKGVYLVANGVEHDRYFVTAPGRYPERKGIGFAFREESFKRTADVIAALTSLRSRGLLEGIRCWAYGSRKRPTDLPGWITYHYRPTDVQLRRLLNETSIFVVSSLYEGWGLPGAEAMACGAALVTTRNGGCEAYAIDGENALFCAPANVEELAAAIARLLQSSEQAAALALKGQEAIQAFTWATAGARFLEYLQEIGRERPS